MGHIKNRQSRDTGNVGHKTQTENKNKTQKKTYTDEQHEPRKKKKT